MGASVTIRSAVAADAPALQEICRRAVLELAGPVYNEHQRGVWAGFFEPFAFTERLFQGDCRVACMSDEPVGMLARHPGDHVDLLYVSPDHARQGIAARLLADAELRAVAEGHAALTTEASLVAAPVFAKAGYVRERQETVSRDGVLFARTFMRKVLPVSGR